MISESAIRLTAWRVENIPSPPDVVKLGSTSERTESGRIKPRKEFTPLRLKFCSPNRSPPIKRASASRPPRTTITTENMVSLASAGLFPLSISDEIIITSMLVTARVRMMVPSGSRNISARWSACLTTANEEESMMRKSHRKRTHPKPKPGLVPSHAFPRIMNASVVP